MSDRGFLPEIEQQLLGSLLDGGDFSAVFAMIDRRHFIEPVHGEIFALCALAREKYNTTRLPVVAKLVTPEIDKAFEKASGTTAAAYMAACLAQTAYGSGNAVQAARNVKEQWGRRVLGTEFAALAEAAASPETHAVELARSAGAVLEEVHAELYRGARGKTRSSLQEAAAAAIALSREAQARKGITGIPTGLVDLDRATGGLQRRDLTLAGARPSMGKTTLGTVAGLTAAASGYGVGFMSLEMDASKLSARICSDILRRQGVKIPYRDIITGMALDDQLSRIEVAMAELGDLPFWIDDQPSLSISDIRMKVESLMAVAEKQGSSLDLLIVDHLGKVRPSSRYSGNRVREIGEATDGLKEIAREYDLAVLLLSQLSRQVESRDDKRPVLADLRDSGEIEQDADTVIFLYRRAYYLEREGPSGQSTDAEIEWQSELAACKNEAEAIIAKQRNGELKAVRLFADMAYSHFANALPKSGYAEYRGTYRGTVDA